MSEWKPENIFHKKTNGVYNGVLFVQEALKNLDPFEKRIVTSREPGMRAVQESLRRPNMPEGIQKWQLPIVIPERYPAFLFITFSDPNVHVPKHVHPYDAITRIIMNGSITIDDVELTQGDWVYIPKGFSYSYTAGQFGALILHFYKDGP